MKKFFFFATMAVAASAIISCEPVKPDTTGGVAVGAENLVAYFPLDSQEKAITLGEGVSVSELGGQGQFTEAGARGGCYVNASKSHDTQAYLKLNVPADFLKKLTSFTFGAWVNAPTERGGIMTFDGGTDPNWGAWDLFLDGEGDAGVTLKGYLFNKYGVMQTGWVKYSGKWLFYNSKGINVVPVVVLDPGHSSDQPGTMVPIGPGADELKEADSLGTRGIVTRVYEYQFTFNIAKKLKTQLEARGYKVILTRNSNKGVYTCIDRAEVANKNKADAFIRIHANGSSNRSRTGAMTICITKENPYIPGMYKSSKLLSEVLLSNYLAAVGSIKSEGIWETDTMTGNNWSKVPTTLVEMGYMTNAQEDKKMQDAAFQKKIVKGLADGIEAYFHKAW